MAETMKAALGMAAFFIGLGTYSLVWSLTSLFKKVR